MAKSPSRKRAGSNGHTTNRGERSTPDPTTTAADIARRAYDMYIARGRAHGHDLDDWLEAERELNSVARPNRAS